LKKSEVATIVPALGASLLPSLSCPACWPAYASALTAVGLSFLGENKYLLWLNIVALLLSLAVLFRRTRKGSYAPVWIGVLAALLILSGKFLLNSNPATWLGAAGLLAAFVLSRPRSKPASCPACIGNSTLEVMNHGVKES
jgi:mercuric ion transport protein